MSAQCAANLAMTGLSLESKFMQIANLTMPTKVVEKKE